MDTNILHQEGLVSANMQLLGRLAIAGLVQVYVPELVRREFLSKKSELAHSAIADSMKGLLLADKKVGNKTGFHNSVQDVQLTLETLDLKIDEAIEADFKEWEQSTKCILIPFNTQSIEQLFDGYFSGTGPYRRPKARDDIPDAVISACIARLASEQPYTYVVVKDGVLKNHLSSIEKIEVTEDLSAFFAVDQIKDCITELDQQLANVVELKELFARADFRGALSDFLRRATEQFRDVYVEDGEVHGKHRLKIDSFGVSVNYASATDIEELSFGEVIFLEDGRFSIPLQLRTTAEIHFCADYSDYLALLPPRNESVRETSMNGDGICDLEEVRKVNLIGDIEINVDASMRAAEIADQLVDVSNGVCETITVELNISTAEII
nr:PIN domain-containing protein [Caballeronia sp. GACF4]